ncbi:MAG: hypothetical protein P1V97_13390 [Planctomycetota bacterium]|nr:hypothetical protein [Planctomycetota bacterium]
MAYQGVSVNVTKDSVEVKTSSGRILHLEPSNVKFDASCKVFAIQVLGEEVRAFGIVGGACFAGGGRLMIENLTFVSRNNEQRPQQLPPPIPIDKTLTIPIQVANARFAWSALCTNVSIDPASKTVSLNSIFGTIKVPYPQPKKMFTEPFRLPLKATIAIQWERYDVQKESTVHARLSVQREDFCYRLSPTYLVNLIDHKTFCHRVSLDQFGIKGPGTYEFVTEVRENNSAVWHVVGISLLTIEFDKEDPANMEVKEEPESV